MNHGKKLAALALGATLALTACGGSGTTAPVDQKKQVQEQAKKATAYLPKNGVELKNYNAAQELYDNPSAIQWCTAFPSSASAPIITVPIAGKLTTSGTSYFSPTDLVRYGEGQINVPSRSVDAMFHGDSFYRYGFTPAGVYMDFSNSMQLLCSTQITEYQRQNTFVEGVNKEATAAEINGLQAAAEEALKTGNGDQASEILKGN